MSLSVSGTQPRAWVRRATTASAGDGAAILVGLLTLGVFVLHLSQLRQSLYGDEVWTYQDIVGRSLGAVISTVHTGAENSPPLFFVTAWAAAKLGDPTVWIRVPSLLLGTATIPLIYLLGRDTVGRIAAVIAAAVIACGPFSLYYGIEARPYAMMAFFVVLSTLALVRAVRGGSRWWWALYALSAAAAAYSHYTAVFVLGAQFAWSLWMCRGRLREPLAANALALVLYLPWLSHIRGKSLGVIALFEPLNFHHVVTDLPRPLFGYPYASLQAIPGSWGLIVIAACLAVGAAALIQRGADKPRNRPEPGRGLGLMALLAVATPVGLLLYSMIGTDLWIARGLYASAPAMALVVGALLAAPPARVRGVVVAVVLLTLLVGTVRAVSSSYARPPFRSIAAELDRRAAPNQAVIMYPSFVDVAIPTQFKRPHLVLPASDAAWRRARSGGTAFAILDDRSMQLFHIPIPHPAGFRLVARRHYKGLVWLNVLTYRAG